MCPSCRHPTPSQNTGFCLAVLAQAKDRFLFVRVSIGDWAERLGIVLLVSGFVPIQVTGSERVGIVLLVFISVGLVHMFYYCSALRFVLVPCNYSYLVYSPCLTHFK